VPATKTTTGIGIKRHANLRDDFLIQLSLAAGHTTTNILPTTTADLPHFNYLTPISRHYPTLECAESHSAQHPHIMSSGSPSGSGRATPSNSSPSPMRRHPGRPQYMTVGNGSTSEHAARLAAMLDTDSGYGGSIADGATFDPTFDQDPMNHLATAQGASCEHYRYLLYAWQNSDRLDSR